MRYARRSKARWMTEALERKLGDLLREETDGCSAGLDSAAWRRAYELVERQQPQYAETVIAYHNQYIAEKRDAFIPMPLVLRIQGKPAGIWPLHLARAGEKWSIGSNSGSIIEPAMTAGIGRNERKRMYRWCLRFLTSLGNFAGAGELRFEAEDGGGDLESWYWILLNSMEIRIEPKHHLYVDLTLPMDEIRSNIRKSYRPLVTKAEKLWKSRILDRIDDGLIAELRRFHIEVSGRETRSAKTWELQQAFVNAGHGFMIEVRSEEGKLVGGALFSRSRDVCSYDVGVYDRSLFDMPIGHLIQMRAIEHAKAQGISLYHIGQRPFAGSDAALTEKEIHIGHFKQGFATRFGFRVHVISRLGGKPV